MRCQLFCWVKGVHWKHGELNVTSRFHICICLSTCCEIYQTEQNFQEHKLGIQKDRSGPGLIHLWNQIMLKKWKSHRWLIFYPSVIGLGFKVGRNWVCQVVASTTSSIKQNRGCTKEWIWTIPLRPRPVRALPESSPRTPALVQCPLPPRDSAPTCGRSSNCTPPASGRLSKLPGHPTHRGRRVAAAHGKHTIHLDAVPLCCPT